MPAPVDFSAILGFSLSDFIKQFLIDHLFLAFGVFFAGFLALVLFSKVFNYLSALSAEMQDRRMAEFNLWAREKRRNFKAMHAGDSDREYEYHFVRFRREIAARRNLALGGRRRRSRRRW